MNRETEPSLPRAWPWWRHLLLHGAIWSSIGLLFALQLTLYGVAEWSVALRIAAVDWSPWIAVGPLIFWLGQKIQFTRRNWQVPAMVHLAGCVGVALMIEFVAATALDLNWVAFPRPVRSRPPSEEIPAPMGTPRDMPPPPNPPGFMREGGPPPDFQERPMQQGTRMPGSKPERPLIFRAGRARVSIPIYWVLVASAHAFAFHRRALERERRALQAEARLTEARLSALQAQLNPHFLFNTLNSVVHYVRADPDAAEEMITTLSDLLRTILAHSEHRVVPLEQELTFIDSYLAIQRMRFSDHLTVRKDIEPAAFTANVPTLLLQPLVENAVIHGIAPERTPGAVRLSARVIKDRLQIEVADTGKGALHALPPGTTLSFQEGVGLSNTRARLLALYGGDHHFTMTPAPEGGVCVTIDIPMRVPSSP